MGLGLFKISAVLAVLGTAALAESPVVVELYTSQGCSSCPPADAMVHDLAERDDVLPLSLHVDYWDYIGWKDTFANAAFTKRQKRYAMIAGRRSVYTPQMIINGQEDVVGARAMELAELIMKHRMAKPVASLSGQRTVKGASVLIAPENGLNFTDFDVVLVRYESEHSVAIKRGENAGKTVTYTNVVRSWDVVEKWNGRSDLTLDVPFSGNQAAAILVQEPGPGKIVAALRLE